MNIDDVLKALSKKHVANASFQDKVAYFKYKHGLNFHIKSKRQGDDEFLKTRTVSTMSPFIRWERTVEYQALYKIYMESNYSKMLEKAYEQIEMNMDKEAIENLNRWINLGKAVSEAADDARKQLGFGKQDKKDKAVSNLKIHRKKEEA